MPLMIISKKPPKRHTVGIQMQEELFTITAKIAKAYHCESLSKLIRCLLLEKAVEFGYDIAGIENPTRGVRRDLASGDKEALEKFRKVGAKGRAVIARNRARRAAKIDNLRKEKEAELES